MRTWFVVTTGVGVAILTIAATRASPPTRQGAQICAPVDSIPVRAWHVAWDTANLSKRALGLGPGDTAGALWMRPESQQRVRVTLATGTFALTVGWLRMARPDTFEQHTLQLWRPSADEFRTMTQHDGFFAPGTPLRGWLSSETHGPMDTATISGVLSKDGGMAFGRADAFLVEDGESYEVAEIDSAGFRGWYSGGAVVPPPLAYFCAVRVK